VIARHEELPAPSNARMVTTLLPTRSGTLADHLPVPAAVPEYPFEVVHFTATTPTLSLAVPLTAMEAEDVATIVNPGERILSDGGVLSALVGGCTGGATGGTTGGTTGGCTGGTTGGITGGWTGGVAGGAAGGPTAGPYSA
jgi:hypothetical protein